MLKDRILERLREAGAGEFVSGQELCEALGVSRTAVWKAVSRLREEGYPIEAVQNRGYRLDEARAESSDLLNEAELNARLSAATRWAGHPCYYAEETGSTNDDIMALGESAPDRLESHPAHNNRAASCCLTEVAHVSREIPKQLVLLSDRVIVRYGYDNTLFHH